MPGLLDTLKQNWRGLLDEVKEAPASILALTQPQAAQQFNAALKQGANIDKEKAVQMAMDVLQTTPMGALGKIVYHGSPHKFDKFDMSKIGTGEGAQAYGHGLYFAESGDVAKSYQKMGNPTVVPADQIATYHAKGQRKADALQEMRGQRDFYKGIGDNDTANKYKEAIKLVKSNAQPQEFGNLYKVDIPDEAVSRMLDWDKPLSQQSEMVRNALQFDSPNRDYLDFAISGNDTSRAYKGLSRALGGDDKASAYLMSKGVPGIRYYDAGSRNAAEGTRNFVLFDDQLPRILERNGQPTGLQPWAPGEWRGLLEP